LGICHRVAPKKVRGDSSGGKEGFGLVLSKAKCLDRSGGRGKKGKCACVGEKRLRNMRGRKNHEEKMLHGSRKGI